MWGLWSAYGVLGDHHLGQQPGSGDALVDDVSGNRGLGQGFALIADPFTTVLPGRLHRFFLMGRPGCSRRQETKGSFPFKVPSKRAIWVSLPTRVVAAAVAVHLIFVS